MASHLLQRYAQLFSNPPLSEYFSKESPDLLHRIDAFRRNLKGYCIPEHPSVFQE